MVFSGSWSPTFTESNSRSAMVKATFFSLFARTTRESREGLLHDVTGLVGDDVPGHDDVGPERPPNGVHVDVAVEPVTGLDRLVNLQLLVNLDDLGVLDADVSVGEERGLRLITEYADERQGREQGFMAEVGGGLLVEEGGVLVLDGDRVLAQLLPPHDVMVGIAVVHPDDVL